MNVELLKATKASIAADPKFNMDQWSHCIASHICRAAGEPVVDGDAFINKDGNEFHIRSRAVELLEMDKDDIPHHLFWDTPEKDFENKQYAYEMIDELVGV